MKNIIFDMVPENALDLNSPDTDGVEVFDLRILCAIAKTKKNILEIGTRFGRTTCNLARFSPPDAKIISVDIDQSQVLRRAIDFYNRISPGKISLFECDSKHFCFDLFGPYDFVFIDGDHSSDGVICDTRNALANLATGGVIVWHDFTSLPILAGLRTLDLCQAQLGAYMGYTKGVRATLPDGSTNVQLQTVADFINEHLKKQGGTHGDH